MYLKIKNACCTLINAFYAQLITVLKIILHSKHQCILYVDSYGIEKTMHVVIKCVLYTDNYGLKKTEYHTWLFMVMIIDHHYLIVTIDGF